MAAVRVDDSEEAFICNPEDTLLRAALRSGLQFSYECNSGGCGCCKIRVLEGEVENLYPEAPALTERDFRKGLVLACQIKCTSEKMVINTRIETWVAALSKPQRFIATLSEKLEIANDLVEFAFELDRDVDYLAGQFFMLTIPGVGERAYSNSSIAADGRKLKFVIKRMPGGKGSNYLFSDARLGDEFGGDGPFGHSYYRENTGRDSVLVAGGSGLSPMLSIIRHLAANPDEACKVHFYYGAKALDELNQEYIQAVAADLGDKFALCCGLSGNEEERASWTGEMGFIHDVLDRNFQNYNDHEFYICGPPPMTAAAQRHLMIGKKVPFGQVHFDRFF